METGNGWREERGRMEGGKGEEDLGNMGGGREAGKDGWSMGNGLGGQRRLEKA